MTRMSKLTVANLALTVFLAGMFFDEQRWGLLLLELVVVGLTIVSIAMTRRSDAYRAAAR